MSPPPPRAVFDCVVYVQALISGRGPAAACLELAHHGQIALFVSPDTLAELRDVPLRPALTGRYRHLTPAAVDAFVLDVERHAVMIDAPPKAFTLPRDPDDEPYVDLAIAAGADYLVTWNQRHLTYLMRADTPEGEDFRRRFPDLKILSPVDFPNDVRAGRQGAGP